MSRKRLLLALNLVPLGISLYLVQHFYAQQLDLQLLSWRNLGYFLALVALSVVGYGNTIWRYIMALKREGAVVDEQVVSERLMYINLISFFLPFGVLNYAAQLALVYRQNPARLVGRAFMHDKLVFLGAIALCFLFTFGHLTPYLSAALHLPPGLVKLGMAGSVLGVVALCAYLAMRHYLRFFVAQLAVFALLNAGIALLLVAYAGLGAAAGPAYLEKLFAYSMAIVLPVSLGGVGPREAILLYDVADPLLRATILNFCVLWFFALMVAALVLLLLKKPASDFAVGQYRRWRRPPPPPGQAQAHSPTPGSAGAAAHSDGQAGAPGMNDAVVRPASARPLAPGAHLAWLGAGLLAAWLGYLYAWVPALSRGDFFLAMMRLARSVEQGHLLYAVTWPLHIVGGHIVFYTRVLQLANYYLFGYSPLFIKFAAMAAWALLGLGVFRFVRRLPPPRQLAALLLLALLTFNPIPWLTIIWADATVPYLSALIALLFVAPTLVAGVEAGWQAAPRRRMALGCVLVIVGSGIGWAILPALGWLAALRLPRQGRGRRILLLATSAVLVVAVAAWLLLAHFAPALRLGLVVSSLASLPSHLDQVAAYYVSLFSTFFGWSRRPWNLVLGAAFLVASLLTCAAHRRREGRATEAELLYVFGLFAMLLVTLGRWKLAADRGEVNPPTYYHLFALPAYYGFVAMALRLLPARRLSRPEAAGLVLLVLVFVFSMPQYQRKLREIRAEFVQMIRPLQGWRMTEATRLIGEPEVDQEVFFEFLPMLKRSGRWPALSGPFHPYKSSRMAPPVATANGSACGGYRNLELLETAPDQRRVYGTALNRPDYRRFVGVARNPARCDQQDIAVSLVAADGTVLCKTWTTPNVHWYFDAPRHRQVLQAGYGFDFTCPVESGAYFLVSQEVDGRVLESLEVLP